MDEWNTLLKTDKNIIIPSWDIVKFVQEIHYKEEDFWEGNILERIERFDYYILKNVPLSKIDRGRYYIDEELVEEYAGRPKKTMPPIILGDIYSGLYDVVDGNHRVESSVLKGYQNILSFVPLYEIRCK